VSSTSTDLYSDTSEIIFQVGQFEQDIYAHAAKSGRYFYSTEPISSSNNSANRTLTSASPTRIERLIRVLLPDGTPARRVDHEDTAAERAPRYYVLGTTIHEVGSDWGSSGILAMTIGFAQSPALLSPTGALTQNVSLLDKGADVLAIRLAEYFARKDTGRDPKEVDDLKARGDERLATLLDSLAHFGGNASRRFVSPEPQNGGS
jgi:hypothetical protein